MILNRRLRSPIWRLPLEGLKKLVESSYTFTAILKFFGLSNIGGNTATLKRRLIESGINFSHIKQGRASNRGRVFNKTHLKPLVACLVENYQGGRAIIKKRLLQEKILPDSCSECGLGREWKGKPLVLVLDHRNGRSTDYRVENLRFLCPNCNSQTNTFAGRSLRKSRSCIKCGRGISRKSLSGLCNPCSKFKLRKVLDRPSLEILEKEVKEKGYCAVGRKYGVTNVAVRKWLKIMRR